MFELGSFVTTPAGNGFVLANEEVCTVVVRLDSRRVERYRPSDVVLHHSPPTNIFWSVVQYKGEPGFVLGVNDSHVLIYLPRHDVGSASPLTYVSMVNSDLQWVGR